MKRGSEWHRWEPHIHAPGTLLADKFSGPDVWEKYISALEAETPVLKAIGVTDYCSLETYRKVKAEKARGRLKDCDVLFPNIELRFDVGTKKGNQVNVHLLINPDTESHEEEAERFLSRLKFEAHGDEFNCTPTDLKKLGRKHNPKISSDDEALKVGINQFKVSRSELFKQYNAMDWARENIILVVAGGADGTSGVQEAADATLREEIEKGAHAIFASSVKQREFWLGRGKLSADAIRERYDSLKPCLWGCDAHELAKVAKPDENRYCWIKGVPSFDSLKQACIDPTRAYVGETIPSWAAPSQVIAEVNVIGAPWLQTPSILLNQGFVAIIGARGSGKTALADIISAGCEAYESANEKPSFLFRAQEKLAGSSVRLKWLDGRESDETHLDKPEVGSAESFKRARYLSQQFVENICSIDGMPELLDEIQRVIFEAHTEAERDGTFDFEELLELRTNGFREERRREESALADISDQIGVEIEKGRLIEGLKAQVTQKKQLLKQFVADKAAIMPKTPNKYAERLQQVEEAAVKVGQNLRYFVSQQQALQVVGAEIKDFRTNEAPGNLRQMKSRNEASGLSEEDWKLFLQTYTGDVSSVIAKETKDAEKNANAWRGKTPTIAVTQDGAFVADDADLTEEDLATLEAEKGRLQKLVTADTETRKKLAALSRRIAEETNALEVLEKALKDAEGAKERAKALVKNREDGYKRIFDAIASEEKALKDLYAPIMKEIAQARGTLAKLSFTVKRTADSDAWAKVGEKELFDLRGGPFKGIGNLVEKARVELKSAWEAGNSEAVSSAMRDFRDKYEKTLLSNAPISSDDKSKYRAWARRFAQWLYSTNHISIVYGIEYDKIDIQKLSPGTRGIVVLMLYLALDKNDVSPLIIDQPEENLDPQSIFDELVPMFEDAKQRRQVIMVTHNANLVVNANADQIIIARVGNHTADGLPPISYQGGGLEEEVIRLQVCDILEGGKEAFKERARRLRISFNR
ncbi:MAG: AAA family ATPase [Nitrospira sp.]|nr:AAA family ATPase [Nitrospira sp.]